MTPKIPAAFTRSVPSTVIILAHIFLLSCAFKPVTAAHQHCYVEIWAAAFVPEDRASAEGTTCLYENWDHIVRGWPFSPTEPRYISGDSRTEPESGKVTYKLGSRVYTQLVLDLDSGKVSGAYGGLNEYKCMDSEGKVLSNKCLKEGEQEKAIQCDAKGGLEYLSEGMHVHLKYTAPNPYALTESDLTSIRGDFNLEIRDTNGKCEEFEYVLTGTHSEYPSHEVFIGDYLIHFANATGDPLTKNPGPPFYSSIYFANGDPQFEMPRSQDVGRKSGTAWLPDRDSKQVPLLGWYGCTGMMSIGCDWWTGVCCQ